MNKNILFVSNNVRDYIKELYENKQSKTVAISYPLYYELSLFIAKIKIFDISGQRDIISNLFLHYMCSDKYKSDNRKEMFDSFMLSLDSIEGGTKIKENIIKIQPQILNIISNSENKELCKQNINDIVSTYFDSIKQNETGSNEYIEIKKQLSQATKEDKQLFMNFFNYVKCNDKECKNKEIVSENNASGKLDIKKENKRITLVELFKGDNVQLNITYEQEEQLKEIKNKMKKFIDDSIKKFAEEQTTIFIKENNIQTGGNLQTGGNPDIYIWIFEFFNKLIENIAKVQIFKPLLTGLQNVLTAAKTGIPAFIESGAFAHIATGVIIFLLICACIGSIAIIYETITNTYENVKYIIKNATFDNIKDLIINFSKKITITIMKFLYEISKGALKMYLNNGYIQTNYPSNNIYRVNQFSNVGGNKNNCYLIPNLKLDILSKFTGINNNKEITKCNSYNRIDIGNKNYILDINDIQYHDYVEENILEHKNQTLNCITDTNLFRNKKKNIGNIWLNLNKQLNTPNMSMSPTKLEILKETIFNNKEMLMFGGDPIEENKKFINGINKNIKYGCTFDIINIMKKIISRLNINKIYLDEKIIKMIKDYIEELSNKETQLNNIMEKMLNVVKLSNGNNETKIMNEQSLDDYAKEQKILLEKSKNIEHKLYRIFDKLNECSNK